jgi:DNA-binding transcriptional MerR regulator
MSSRVSDRPYLSIGEVLGLLLEEFPDVTISKIRFLESQGLIDPERTPSGYRKFYDGDVDRLRVILREQRENFLPLKVIRDRLESGEIDSDGTVSATPPRGIRNVTVLPVGDETRELSAPTRNHPSAQLRLAQPPPVHRQSLPPAGPVSPSVEQVHVAPAADAMGSNGAAAPKAAAQPPTAGDRVPTAPLIAPVPVLAARSDHRDTYSGMELCAMAGITAAQLVEIESFGLVTGRGSGAAALYAGTDLAIAKAASGFLQRGVEGRHLRAWRQAAEREASLFEQLILPMMRQRNPQSRQQAVDTLTELSSLGGELRSAILYSALRHHLEGS